VSVIDTTTKQVAKTIGVGASPLSVAASPDGKHVYVANSADNTVSVIDTATQQVTDTIAIPVQPGTNPEWGEYQNIVTDVAVSPDNNRVYVNASDGTVSVIDTAAGSPTYDKVISTAPGYHPTGQLSADHLGYNASQSGLIVVDPTTNTIVDRIQVGPTWNLDSTQSEFTEAVHDVAVNHVGTRAYVTETVETVARGVGGQTNGEFITDSQGGNWLVTGTYGAVSVVDTDPNSPTYQKEIAFIKVPAGAQNVALSKDGKFAYVTSWDGKTVTVIDTATNAVVGSFTTDQTSASPRGVYIDINPIPYPTRYITVDPNDGTLWVTDYTDNTVYAVTVIVGDPATAV
jgi:YVTN family beta-propeller protein